MKKIIFLLIILLFFTFALGENICKFPYGSQYTETEYNSIIKLIGRYDNADYKIVYLCEKEGKLEILIESNEGENIFNGKSFNDYLIEKISDSIYYIPEIDLSVRIGRYENYFGDNLIMNNDEYTRIFYGPEFGETFKIESLYHEKQLRKMAEEAEFPFDENYEFNLINLEDLDESIIIDIKYATSDNFMGISLYSDNLAYLQKDAAMNILKVIEELKDYGMGIVVYDAYRPWFVTKMFYDATPNNLKRFVANPDYGSKHNRGGAVDLSLYFLQSGDIVDMGSDYDEFSERAYSDYPALSDSSRYFRDLLKNVMDKNGFTQYEYEWWHFDFKDWKNYPVMNTRFENIK